MFNNLTTLSASIYHIRSNYITVYELITKIEWTNQSTQNALSEVENLIILISAESEELILQGHVHFGRIHFGMACLTLESLEGGKTKANAPSKNHCDSKLVELLMEGFWEDYKILQFYHYII